MVARQVVLAAALRIASVAAALKRESKSLHRVGRPMTYFDSCYLAKLYLMEADSERAREYARTSDGLACAVESGLREIYSSDHHLVSAAAFFGLRAVTL